MIDIVIQLIWSIPLIILATTAAVLAYRNNPAWGWFLLTAAMVMLYTSRSYTSPDSERQQCHQVETKQPDDQKSQ